MYLKTPIFLPFTPEISWFSDGGTIIRQPEEFHEVRYFSTQLQDAGGIGIDRRSVEQLQ